MIGKLQAILRRNDNKSTFTQNVGLTATNVETLNSEQKQVFKSFCYNITEKTVKDSYGGSKVVYTVNL